MSTKFEQLLDLIVNEESEKAQELFHAIVVEKSREIYENLIAEEAEEEADESVEEAAEEEADESVEEAAEEADESVEENMDLEDSYSMEADEEDPMSHTGDATDDFGAEIGDDMGGEEDHEADEDSAIMDIKSAIEELEAAFAELEKAQGGEAAHDFGDEEGEEDGEEDEMEMMGMQEGRRMTREYVEKVGNDWDKNSQKTQGQNAGAGTGDTASAPDAGKSPVGSGKGKITTSANPDSLNQGAVEGQNNTGTSPNKVNKGITPEKSEKFASGNGNVPGGKMGVKNLSKVGAGYPGNNKTPGPVGSGTGDKAGQTSVSSSKPLLKPAN